jgi:excinuclease ABC subunit A
VQRINLTTALGTSLVNTLFVLDEPSIGLHPRDMNRVIGVMQRLRDAGNSLVVVEHDPQVMFAADRMLDIGPGPGERGGEIVFWGAPEALHRRAHPDRPTICSGRRHVDHRAAPCRSSVDPAAAARRRTRTQPEERSNVEIPLGRLVCVTGCVRQRQSRR